MTASAPLPDAAPSNWVDRRAPPALRPWLKLGRFDRPAGIWLLMLPGWQGIALAAGADGRLPPPGLLAAFLLGAALMRAAGCAYNDIVDRDIDAKVARTAGRPIPSGQITVKQAASFVVACSLIACVILLMLSPLAVGLGIASLALVAAYPFMKRITWWPQAWLGLTFNWGALMGYAAASAWGPGVLGALLVGLSSPFGGDLDPGRLGLAAVLLYVSGLFWTLGYDSIYAIQDLEDDALAGVKSSARRLGAKAPRAITGFYLASILFAGLAGWTAGLSLLAIPLFALFAAHLMLQARRVRIDQPRQALVLFKSNVWAGALLFAAIVAGSVQVG